MKRTPMKPGNPLARGGPLRSVGKKKRDAEHKHKAKRKKALKAKPDPVKALWSKVVRARANHICEWCGAPATQAHHMETCEYLAFRYNLSNGVAVCSRCHDGFTYGGTAGQNAGWALFESQRPEDCATVRALQKATVHKIEIDLAEIRADLKRELECYGL